MLSWDADETVRIWDAATGRELARHTHESVSRGARLSSDGRRVISWSADSSTLWVWDWLQEARSPPTNTHSSCQAQKSEPMADGVSSVSDETFRVWDTETGIELDSSTHDGTGLSSLGAELASDGRRVWPGVTVEPSACGMSALVGPSRLVRISDRRSLQRKLSRGQEAAAARSSPETAAHSVRRIARATISSFLSATC